MATYTITASAVLPAGTSLGALAGEAINAGEVVRIDSTDGKAYKAESADTEQKARASGIAVNTAVAGQPVSYVSSGDVTVDAGLFTTIGVGALLVLAPTAGKAMDVGDLATTNWVTILGWVVAANKLRLSITRTATQIP